jgi:hypothetical protein
VISVPQFANALRGLRLMAAFDSKAWTCFDKTIAGFWASFVVAFALLPLNLIHVVLQFQSRPPTLAFVPYMIVEFLTYVLQWAMFPFVMMYVADLLQRRPRYFAHMVAYNWLQLPLTLFFLVVRIAGDLHVISPQAMGALELVGLATFFVYGTFIAGVGLQVGIGTALALVVLDFVLSMITGQLIVRIET